MFKKILKIKDKSLFHLTLIIGFIICVLIVALYFILKYDMEGEKFSNLPFYIDKINIVSSITSNNVSSDEVDYRGIIDQNNDVYIYFEKNVEQDETIKQIKISNIKIVKDNQFSYEIYMPSKEDFLFKNSQENLLVDDEIIYTGDKTSDVKNQVISNNGDVIKLRITAKDVYEYEITNDEIDYNLILNNSTLTQQDLEATILLDIEITTNTDKKYITTLDITVPVEGVIESGKSSQEIDEKQLIFKRE